MWHARLAKMHRTRKPRTLEDWGKGGPLARSGSGQLWYEPKLPAGRKARGARITVSVMLRLPRLRCQCRVFGTHCTDSQARKRDDGKSLRHCVIRGTGDGGRKAGGFTPPRALTRAAPVGYLRTDEDNFRLILVGYASRRCAKKAFSSASDSGAAMPS